MQLLCNSSLDLLWISIFQPLRENSPIDKAQALCEMESDSLGLKSVIAVSLILPLQRQSMWGPLTPNSNLPARCFIFTWEKYQLHIPSPQFSPPPGRAESKTFQEVRDRTQCFYVALNTLQKPSIIQVLLEMTRMGYWGMCVYVHRCVHPHGVERWQSPMRSTSGILNPNWMGVTVSWEQNCGISIGIPLSGKK